MLNLDTHIVIAMFNDGLSVRERELISTSALSISDIVLWEIARLRQYGRIEIRTEGPEMARFLERAKTWPIDVRVAVASTRLDFHSDPADELIAATSVVHRIPLLTRDAKILASKVVPLA